VRRGALLLAIVTAAASCDRAEPRVVHVYAAASLREACEVFERNWTAEHADVRLSFNFGASNVLATQALAGRRADLFLSADVEQTAALLAAGQVVREAPRPWLSNQLVVVVPSSRPDLAFETPRDLAGEPVRRLSIGNPESVPAGRYAKRWLESEGLWGALAARVAPAVDVRAALGAVESGACEAGVVYSTDASITSRVRIALRVPLEQGPQIEYALVELQGPAERADADAVFDTLLASGELFARLGFLVGEVR